MTRIQKEKARAGLTLAIDQWLNEQQESVEPFDCWVGEETASLMADAAFSVIAGVEDAYQYMKRENVIVKEEAA